LRTNYSTTVALGVLGAIQALVYEALATAPHPLLAAAAARMLAVREIAAATCASLQVAESLAPARVMFLPAGTGLLGTLASITLTGMVAALQVLRSSGV